MGKPSIIMYEYVDKILLVYSTLPQIAKRKQKMLHNLPCSLPLLSMANFLAQRLI